MATLADLQGQRQQFFKQKGEQQQGQIQGETQGNVEALQRRFTSMGAANTGASIAAEQKARDAGLAQQRQATTDLAGQQLQAGEGDIARQAQTEESALGRAFAGQQAQLGQTFQGEQARLGREASLGEAGAARAFQEKMANQDIGFKRELAGTEQGNKIREMDLAQQQFQLDKDTTAFNQRMAEIEAGRTPSTGISGQISNAVQGIIPKTGEDLAYQALLGPVSQIKEPIKNVVNDIKKRLGW